jgi:hypothetical protein
MIETRGNWSGGIKGIELDIVGWYDQALDEYTPGISNLINVMSTDMARLKWTGKTGVSGGARRFDETENIPEDERHMTYETEVIPQKYGNSLSVSKEKIDDAAVEEVRQETRDITLDMQYSIDKAGMQLYNGGFATTQEVAGFKLYFYGDEVPTFSVQHPSLVPGASTQSNASATGITYGDDNLEVAKLAIRRQKTDTGKPMAMMGKFQQVVPWALEKQAMQVTESELVSENANNAINVYKGNIDTATSQFLDDSLGGSDTAWFLQISGRNKLYHVQRTGTEIDSQYNKKNQTYEFYISTRFAPAVKDWRYTWGSKGDGAAYSS